MKEIREREREREREKVGIRGGSDKNSVWLMTLWHAFGDTDYVTVIKEQKNKTK